jgi:hypothetical protein
MPAPAAVDADVHARSGIVDLIPAETCFAVSGLVETRGVEAGNVGSTPAESEQTEGLLGMTNGTRLRNETNKVFVFSG